MVVILTLRICNEVDGNGHKLDGTSSAPARDSIGIKAVTRVLCGLQSLDVLIR